MLDELIAEHGETGAAAPAATTIDYLSVADELAGNISITEDSARATYRDIEDSLTTLFSIRTPPLDPLPPTDRDSIAAELRLERARGPQALDRIRREFARENHPDRVADHLRECAMVRMQLANMLIDEAKARLVTPAQARG
jgi:hypothetical protein